jgi:hypothetical protein
MRRCRKKLSSLLTLGLLDEYVIVTTNYSIFNRNYDSFYLSSVITGLKNPRNLQEKACCMAELRLNSHLELI